MPPTRYLFKPNTLTGRDQLALSNGRECKCKTAKVHGDRHIKKAKVPGNENSRKRMFHRTFVPGSERAGERKGQEAKVPGSELARVARYHNIAGL